MNRVLALATFVAIAFAPPVQAVTIFDATLDGSQEVPSVTTSAMGTAQLILNDAMTELSYDITIMGLDFGMELTPGDTSDDITRLHIHAAQAGANGGIVFGILDPQHDLDDRVVDVDVNAGTVRFTGVWDDDDVQNGANQLSTRLADLNANGLYLNVHTNRFGGGEIRGQILFGAVVPEPGSTLLLAVGLVGLGLCGRRKRRA